MLKKKNANLQGEHDDLQEAKAKVDENMSKLENNLQQLHTKSRTQDAQLAKLDRQLIDSQANNAEKQKALDMATAKMNEFERAKRKVQRECVGLENDKKRLTQEKNDSIAEKE